jgi:eukaryotic-like serine/threonine-protein kinase
VTVPSVLSGALANRYRIERELGAGGMATVYLAEDFKHDRMVAIKVLRPHLASTVGPDRFLREIRIAAQLQHPHILPLLESGEAAGFLFFVMPYVEGQSLRERLTSQGELPVHEAVRLISEVVDALGYAHGRGLVHRDVKPENVMLSGRHALVMDFGVAKAVGEASGRNQLTTAGIALGTPTYMAPEQAAADPQLDARVDIYAVGVLAYEMLTGYPPFHGLDPQQTLVAHITQAPMPIDQRRPGLSPALAGVVMRCLEKRPADRFQSAEELMAALEPLATPSGGITPIATRPMRVAPVRSRRSLLVGTGVLLLVVLAAWAAGGRLRAAPLSLAIANIRQVTREPEAEIHVALSPDGREVAYESGYIFHTHIVVRDIAGGRPIPLTDQWPGIQRVPGWMPDGRSIVFTNLVPVPSPEYPDGRWKIPRLGGQAVMLDSADRLALDHGLTVVIREDSAFALGADGREQFLRIAIPEVHSNAISEIHSWTTRPDGGAIAYVVGNPNQVPDWGSVAPSAIWVAPRGGSPVRVTDSTSMNVSPAWLPDGTLLFVSNRDGARDIYALRLDRSGAPRGSPLRLTTGLDAYSVSVSADGRTAAYDRFTLRRNIYTIPVPRSGSVSLRDARPLTTGNQIIENFGISADGKSIVFDSNIEGNQQIFMIPATGGEPRRVTRDGADNFSPEFSPDGRQIVFHTTRNATRDIFVVNTDGSGEQRLTSDAEESYHPAFSPDGLWIAYGNGSRSLGLLHRAALDAPWQVTERQPTDRGFVPRWSPDGSRLALEVPNREGRVDIVIRRVADGTARILIKAGANGIQYPRWPEWSEDGKTIYFRDAGNEGTPGIYGVPASGGTPRLLVRFDDPGQSVLTASVPARNGLFYLSVGEIESDIYLMDLVRK